MVHLEGIIANLSGLSCPMGLDSIALFVKTLLKSHLILQDYNSGHADINTSLCISPHYVSLCKVCSLRSSCHHHWLFSNMKPKLTACKLCIQNGEPTSIKWGIDLTVWSIPLCFSLVCCCVIVARQSFYQRLSYTAQCEYSIIAAYGNQAVGIVM